MRSGITLVLFLLSATTFGQFVNGTFQNAFAYACNAGPGWDYSTGNGTEPQITDVFQAGNAWIDITPCGGWGNGTWVQQTVTTVPNQCYSVTFDLGSFCGWDASDAGMYVSIDGVILGDRIVNDVFDCTGTGLHWATFTSPVFVATSASTTIRLTAEGRCSALSVSTGQYACAPVGALGNPGVIGLDNVILNSLGFSSTTTTLPDVSICPSQSVTIGTSIPGVTYLWSTGATSPTISVNNPGTYTFTYSSSCASGTGTVDVIALSAPPEIHLGNDTMLCPPFVYQLPQQPQIVNWSTGVQATAIEVTSPGKYWATLSNTCGISTDSILVSIPATFAFDLADEYSLCSGDSLHFDLPSNAMDILWSSGENSSHFTVMNSGSYAVSFSDGCHILTEPFDVVEEDCQCHFYLPNAFTADNDGTNDIWKPALDPNCDFTLSIYNRWGEKMFETASSDEVWVGNSKEGNWYVPDGIYTYFLKYRTKRSEMKEQTGYICVIR